MIIRTEDAPDFSAIYEFVKVAFQTAKVCDGDEQNFVYRLRANGNYIPELALVAEENAQIIGHIMLTKGCITSVDGVNHEVLILAPLAVDITHRSKGIGGKLIKTVCDKAAVMGYGAVLLMGDPAYYGRFGFRQTVDFGITNKNDIPDEYVMALEIIPGALKNINGAIKFPV